MNVTILDGDCRESMLGIPPNSVDAIVTDPPYGIEFMGRGWDHGVPGRSFFRAMLNAAKPGAHLFAFGGTRLYHRMTCAIEDAGWEVRDCLMWLYGSGFPKSLDVGKAIDKKAGAKREVVGTKKGLDPKKTRPGSAGAAHSDVAGVTKDFDITAPATKLAKRFDGYGTALKPAWEPIILAMKPMLDGAAVNAKEHGVAGMNIRGARIGDEPMKVTQSTGKKAGRSPSMAAPLTETEVVGVEAGRWPANVVVDPDTAALLGDKARFFYGAKSKKADRVYVDPDTGEEMLSDHPTVKPQDLMRWLVRLASPPGGGVILDPFMGSGSTGVACAAEGVQHFIGCERVEHFQKIARARIGAALK